MPQPRAVTPQLREARRQALLDAAWELFQEHELEQISMQVVANQAGLAKGTVYLYFQTKEELFLAIQRQQMHAWLADLTARFATIRGPNLPHQLATAASSSLADRPGMTRLMAILHPILEHNTPIPAVLDFKQFMLAEMQSCAVGLHAAIPGISVPQAVRLLLWVYALILGLHQVTHPAASLRAALASDPALAPFQLDFTQECTAAIETLLSGLGPAAWAS